MPETLPRPTATLVLLVGLCACDSRSIGHTDDAGANDFTTPPSDARFDGDADAPCGCDPLAAGFVLDTNIAPTNSAPTVDDYLVHGTVIYHGDITDPLTPNPAFNREVQLVDGAGEVSVLQYYLPLDLELPLQLEQPYAMTFRERWGFHGHAVGVVIHRVTLGEWPLVAVGDTGDYWRAFTSEDPVMTPLTVFSENQPQCPTEPDPVCGGLIYRDALHFESSTDGAITDVTLFQGEAALFPIQGFDFLVVNMESTHRYGVCADASNSDIAYLALSLDEEAMSCNPTVTHRTDGPGPIEEGSACDDISFCTADPNLVQAAQQIAPDLQCLHGDTPCGINEYACIWWVPTNVVTAEIYEQLCAVTLLEPGPTEIWCNIHL